jgi:cobalt/nickel transport system permease protein
VHLEEFAGGSTFLHRVDPRVKFVSAVPMIVLVAVMRGTSGPVLALLVACGLAAAGRLHPIKILQRLAALNAFLLLLWVSLPFGYPGEPILELGPLSASREGALYALGITLKGNAIALLTIAVFGTSELLSLAHALVHLRVPGKFVHLFFFFYRYISVLHEEYARLRNAMKVRGFKAGTSMHTYRSYAYLVGMLVVRSYERSQRIYDAMLCRGFKGHFPVMSHFHLHGSDIAFGIFMALITIALGLGPWPT